jgi:molybdate transport system substrate-binding protein
MERPIMALLAEPDAASGWLKRFGRTAMAALWIVGGVVALTGCGPAGGASAEDETLTVFAAASLTDVFEAIGEIYEREHPGSDVIFNFGASSALRTQLAEGAVADVAAFASEEDMRLLGAGGLVTEESARIFASNEIVVVVHPDSAGMVASLSDLTSPGTKIVMAAEGVPAGDYARQILHNLGEAFAGGVLANVVSEEDNVRQVLAKVQLGEADAGLVYRSDARAAPELGTIEIPAEANVLASYPIASLREASNPSAAEDFIGMVLSAEGQRLIGEGGFLPANP